MLSSAAVAAMAFASSVRPAPVGARACCACRRPTAPTMLARKAFKGGNLDDFLSAGEAEAKYGPRRYAAVSDDLYKTEVSKARTEAERERSNREYAAQKVQILSDHLFLSLLGAAAMWTFFDVKAVGSYAAGAGLGALYLYLLQRNADSFGATEIENVSRTPPPIVVPVLLVLLVAKNPGSLALIPCLGGFATNQLATLLQICYPPGWGVPDDTAAGA